MTTPYTDEVMDTHQYYTSRTLLNQLGTHYYVETDEIQNTRVHDTLSGSHRIASSIQLSFTFPFYGHDVRQVTVATGGFLYMSDFLHQWLTATQYIAPLMANFDTRIGNETSRILYADTGEIFYVWWEGVQLHDEPEHGSFSFQVQLHDDGKIVFAYKDVPRRLAQLSTNQHPVRVGVSDAYYIDNQINDNVIRRTIYEYHRVEIPLAQVQEAGAIVLTPEVLCHDMTSCSSCVTADIAFDCVWCNALSRCSDGFDRYRQEFLESDCHDEVVVNRSACFDVTPPPSTSKPSETEQTTPETSASTSSETEPSPTAGNLMSLSSLSMHELERIRERARARHEMRKLKAMCEEKGITTQGNCSNSSLAAGALAVIVIVVIIFVSLIVGLGAWFVYAYRNPNTKSGRWLIEHRPSELRSQLSKVRFWRKDASASGGGSAANDKYSVSVDSTA